MNCPYRNDLHPQNQMPCSSRLNLLKNFAVTAVTLQRNGIKISRCTERINAREPRRPVFFQPTGACVRASKAQECANRLESGHRVF